MLSTITVTFTSLTLLPQTTCAAPSLTLHVSGPRTIKGVENIKLVTTAINTGDETLKLFNDPNSPLSLAQMDTFNIKDPASRKPLFTGIDIPYDPSQATAVGREDTFIILAPGQSVDIEHECMYLQDLQNISLNKHDSAVSEYNFPLLDSGFDSFKACNVFYYLEPSTLTSVSINPYAVVHEIFISGGLAVIRNSALQKRDYVGCSDTETQVLQNRAQAAQNYVSEAVTCVSHCITLAISDIDCRTALCLVHPCLLFVINSGSANSIPSSMPLSLSTSPICKPLAIPH